MGALGALRHSRAALGCAVVAGICSGCLILPETRTSRRVIGTRVRLEDRGRPGAVALSLQSRGRELTVTAERPRECVRRTVQVVEVTSEREASVDANLSGDDKYAFAVWLLVSPVTGFFSGIGTALVLAFDGETTSHQEVPLAPERTACPVAAAGVPVVLTLPSGAELNGTTDERGVTRFTVPETEPDRGIVVARTDVSLAQRFRYGGAPDPLTRDEVRVGLATARSAIQRCGRQAGLQGIWVLSIVIDGGHASLRRLDTAGSTFAACVDAALLRVLFRSAGRLQVRYPFRFAPKPPAPPPRKPTLDIPAEDLVELRKTCAMPIANWRAGHTDGVPEKCRVLVEE